MLYPISIKSTSTIATARFNSYISITPTITVSFHCYSPLLCVSTVICVDRLRRTMVIKYTTVRKWIYMVNIYRLNYTYHVWNIITLIYIQAWNSLTVTLFAPFSVLLQYILELLYSKRPVEQTKYWVTLVLYFVFRFKVLFRFIKPY